MTWNVSVVGNAEQIVSAFEEQKIQSAGDGMIIAELEDIVGARDSALQYAEKYGRVSVSASGHWVVFGVGDPRNTFGGVSLSIGAAPKES